MSIDIEKLSVEELFSLNHRIVDRIRYLQGLKTRAHLDRFEVGDKVQFMSDGRPVAGLVVRVNQKSLSVRTQNSHWTIHPRLVTKMGSSRPKMPLNVDDILKGDLG